ncbi:MAG: hypothetical protein R3225_02855, partial [Halofilum sp. (in: g-proteobacteria)]|nr:hypothetical protein [Halofilum sp. (in: g-proteobacteria)]
DVYNPEVLFRPVPLEGEAATAVAAHLAELSAPLSTSLQIDNGRAWLDLETPNARAATTEP